MENIGAFMKWVFGILITLAIITTGILLYNQTLPITNAVSQAQASQNQYILDSEYSAFDNQIVSGSQIITAYRRYSTQTSFYLYVSDGRQFAVEPSQSTSQCLTFDYGSGEVGTSKSYCSVTDTQMQDIRNSSYYIPPQKSYTAQLVKDGNERVTAIYFNAN